MVVSETDARRSNDPEESAMYIGLGTILLILLVVVLFSVMRRRA
jgi:hypothetical protein